MIPLDDDARSISEEGDWDESTQPWSLLAMMSLFICRSADSDHYYDGIDRWFAESTKDKHWKE